MRDALKQATNGAGEKCSVIPQIEISLDEYGPQHEALGCVADAVEAETGD